MTKKITELLELLSDSRASSFTLTLFKNGDIVIQDIYGERGWNIHKGNTLNYRCTTIWNQLTGDNLKDVTWIL